LYDAHRDRVYRLMVRMIGTADAADLTQQVFLQMLRSIGRFAGHAQFQTWLYRVAVNEALQHLRKSRRTKSCSLEHEVVDGSPTADRRSEHAELLEQALARLEPDLRCVFVLREVEGLPYHGIATALRINEGTVGSRLNRARRLLRHHLIELGWQP
jgi:RNA polymerase sigma-70 factor (ECF subfamily)